MSKNKVIKSVSFNITNADDLKTLKAVEGLNFSGYVKELILKDINTKEKEKQQRGPNVSVKKANIKYITNPG